MNQRYTDEARYGRASLLILNVCPFTLRHVINDYYVKHGCTSLQDFLDKNKHDLYHILNRRCCSRRIQSRVTPMNRSQGDLLFNKNSSPCRTGYTGDCPCQYDAKPGVTLDVMDITLCCLFIKNICSRHSGINMAHVETVRTIRNHIIHAEKAQLDVPTYNGYWNQVKTALLDLANHVSHTVHTDTLTMIQDLETRVMNAGDLGEIRKMIVDVKRIEVVEERVSKVEKDFDAASKDNEQVKKTVKETAEKMTQIEGSVTQTTEELRKLGDTVQKSAELDRGVKRRLSQIDEEIRKVTVDDKRIKVVEKMVSNVEKDLEAASKATIQVKKNMEETAEKVTQIKGTMTQTTDKLEKLGETVHKKAADYRGVKTRLSQLEETVGVQGQEIKDMRQEKKNVQDKETDVSRLKQKLVKVNNDLTKVITLSPLQERGKELPLELLFSQVVIRKDPKYTEMGDKSDSTFGSDTSNQLPVSADTDIVSDSDSDSQTSFWRRMLYRNERKLVNPCDIFKINEEFSSHIYMLGAAAHGKTTYCKWLVKKWCNAQQEDDLGRELDVWETSLKEFDFVFLLEFRYVNPNRACVVDMICHDVYRSLKGCHATIRHVLSSERYKSLIIMDGLDEWDPNEETRKQLTCQHGHGIPNVDELSSTVTNFTSMRPWVFPAISKYVQRNDIVIEILGLSEDGMEKVIKNVLLNHYKLTDNSAKYKKIYERIKMNLIQNSLKSFIQIPLLAVVCVQIWYEGKQVGDSMTSFYAEMLDMLIERAHEKRELKPEHGKMIEDRISVILSQHECIRQYISLLTKLGKVAYEGLISNETVLVFQKRKLVNEIGKRELQFALDVGLLSETESESLFKKNVSVSFFHKSIQEFLAVIYMVMNKEVGESFCKYLSSIKFILELSNVIRFICGMCPSLGSVISQRVVSVAERDPSICKYRESPWSWQNLFPNEWNIAEKLFKIQLMWYMELPDRQTDNPVTFYISDVFFNVSADVDTVRMIRDHHVDIRSLNLYCLPPDVEHGITNIELDDLLCNNHNNTRSLVMVAIIGDRTDRFVNPLCKPSLRYLHLRNVQINNTLLDGNRCSQLLTQAAYCDKRLILSNMASLHVVHLTRVSLGDRGLDLSGMASLKNLELEHMKLRGLDLNKMPSLQELKLKDITLGDRGLDLSDMSSLQKIQLENMNLGDRGLHLSGMTLLQELKLKCIILINQGLDLSDMPSLHVLELEFMTLVDRGLDLSGVTSLQWLKLKYTTLGDRGLDLSDMTSLQVLKLENITLVDRGLDLSKMTSLRALELKYITLGDRGLDLSNLTPLLVLKLEYITLGDRGLDLSKMTSLQVLKLEYITLGDRELDLSKMTSLQVLKLENITLGDRGLDLSASMLDIKKVTLCSVNMSAEQWQEFLLSVLSIQHEFNVELNCTIIDEEFKTRIQSSPDLNLTKDWGRYKFHFTRVWPLSHDNEEEEKEKEATKVTHDNDGNEILYTRY